MVDYANRFPDIFVDETGNLRLDNLDVSISGGAITASADDVTINRTTTVNNRLFGEEGIYFKNELPSSTGQPAGYVTLGFDANQPLLISEDFTQPKTLDARATRILSESATLDPFDEFILLGGTELDPIVVTFPTTNVFANTKIYYEGGVGSFYGQIQTGNVDLVMFNIATGSEVFRGTDLDLNTGSTIEFRYTIISLNPTVAQWSAGIS